MSICLSIYIYIYIYISICLSIYRSVYLYIYIMCLICLSKGRNTQKTKTHKQTKKHVHTQKTNKPNHQRTTSSRAVNRGTNCWPGHMLAALALANRSSLAKTDIPTQRGDGFMRVHPSIVYVRKLLTIATSMLAGAGPYAPPCCV